MNVPTGERQVRMFLQKFGEKAEFYTKDQTGTTALNHPDETWTKLGTEPALLHYSKTHRETTSEDFEGGHRVEQAPRFVLAVDTVAVEKCHMIYDDMEFELTALIDRGHHKTGNSRRRQDGSLLDEL